MSVAELDLSHWVKAPPLLLERKGALDARSGRGWRPNRLILINYWRFGYEVFHFTQGRLVLRGANTTGKSTVLVSAITFVLDMERRRERLDTFGGQGRGMAYYLLGHPDATPESDLYYEERTGYVALEFMRGGEYLTIGVGLYSNRNRPDLAVDAWGFVVTDGSRAGEGFDLCDERRIPLTQRELADRLAGRGHVETRVAGYQALVNRYLFGFDSLQAYEFLLSLLHQLRSPKLNKDTKPSIICEMLTAALPPLPGDLLDQVTQIINDIDLCLETVETTDRYVQAVTEIDDKQAMYLNQCAQRGAVLYLQARERAQAAARAWQEAAQRLEGCRCACESVREQRRQNAEAITATRAVLDVLEQHEAFQSQRQLESLVRDLEAARQAKVRSDAALSDAEAHVHRLQAREAGLRRSWDDGRAALVAKAAAALRAAGEAAWPIAEAELRPVAERARGLRLDEGPIDASIVPLAALRAAAEERQARLARVLKALIAVAEAERRYTAARERVRQAAEALKAADGDVTQALERLDEACAAGQEALAAWATACAVFVAEEDLVEQVRDEIGRHAAAGGDVRACLTPLIEAVYAQERPLLAEVQRLGVSLSRLQERRQALAAELQAWEARADPEPARHPARVRAREILAERGIWACPLYLACEVDGLDEATAAALERTLEAAGLLDALIVDAARAQEVESVLQEPLLADTWIRPAAPGDTSEPASLTPATLDAVLRPAELGHRRTDVQRALRRIGWFSDSASLLSAELTGDAALSPEPAAAVSPEAWRAGPLYGTVTVEGEPVVRYLGSLNRRRFREREIRRLQREIEQLEGEIWDLESAMDAMRSRIERLRQEGESLTVLPVWHSINTAASRWEQARAWLVRQREALDKAEQEAERVYTLLTAARAAHEETLAEMPEARGRDAEGIRELERRTAEVLAAGERAAGEAGQLGRVQQRFQETIEDLAQATRRLAASREASEAEARRVIELSARERIVREQLASHDIEALSRQVADAKAQLAALDAERERLATENGRLQSELEALEGEVKRLQAEAAERRDAEAQRRMDLTEQLRAYPTLAPLLQRVEADPGAAPFDVAQELLKHRRGDDGRLLDLVERGIQDALTDLSKAFAEHRALLVEYAPEFAEGRVTFRQRGEHVEPHRLRRTLEGELLLHRRVLQEKESELYEEVILRDVAREIRGRIALAHDWCDDVNALLAGKRLSNGEVLSLRWRPQAPNRTTGIDPRRAVELLSREVDTLTDAEVAELIEHFRRRVGDVRDRYRRQSLEKPFGEALAESLDYRSWFRFSLHSQLPSEPVRELTDLVFASRSGAEKSLAMFIPILTAVHAHYRSAADDAPKLVGIDEAFAGVDEQNVAEMFRFLVELDFSWIMTSEKLWGVGAALPGCSTYELVKGAGGVIAPIWFVWDGRQLLDGFGNGTAPHGGNDVR